MKNWLVALVALALGVGLSAALIVFANPARDQVQVYAVARDIPSGAVITQDSLRLEQVIIAGGVALLFVQGDESQLAGIRAGHDLPAGELLQRSDVLAAGSAADERLVLVPIKNAPPASPGSKIDLLVIGGTPDRPTVIPFALGLDVRSVVTGGFVVAVPSKQAAAFIYAAEAMHLAAVVASAGAAPGGESPVAGPDQAMAAVAQPRSLSTRRRLRPPSGRGWRRGSPASLGDARGRGCGSRTSSGSTTWSAPSCAKRRPPTRM